jgi:hypothetical protein
MSQVQIQLFSEWDAEASVWVASSVDAPGLVTEAPTLYDLVVKLRCLIPELLELNGKEYSGFSLSLSQTPTRIPRLRRWYGGR